MKNSSREPALTALLIAAGAAGALYLALITIAGSADDSDRVRNDFLAVLVPTWPAAVAAGLTMLFFGAWLLTELHRQRGQRRSREGFVDAGVVDADPAGAINAVLEEEPSAFPASTTNPDARAVTARSAGPVPEKRTDTAPERRQPIGASEVSLSLSNAVRATKAYLGSRSGFSRAALIEQLVYEGFGEGEAASAVETIRVDWSEQASTSARSYLSTSPFSEGGLREQLEHDGYSNAEVSAAAAGVGADWDAQAIRSAKQYLKSSAFSRVSLRDQLVHDGFSDEQAAAGLKGVGYV